jgi:hypothetical protein
MREMLIAVSAECAFKRADASRQRGWRKINIAAFTVGAKFQHRVTPEEVYPSASRLLARMSSQ